MEISGRGAGANLAFRWLSFVFCFLFWVGCVLLLLSMAADLIFANIFAGRRPAAKPVCRFASISLETRHRQGCQVVFFTEFYRVLPSFTEFYRVFRHRVTRNTVGHGKTR